MRRDGGASERKPYPSDSSDERWALIEPVITAFALADQDDAELAAPPPRCPAHPAYRQILTAFADLDRPLRARDLCQALDPPIVGKNTENIR